MNINPLTIDGKEWPFLSVNLAITSKHNPDGAMDASVAARFIPTRVENGEVITKEDAALTFFRGSLSELKDSHEVAAMTAIKTALEEFVASKVASR